MSLGALATALLIPPANLLTAAAAGLAAVAGGLRRLGLAVLAVAVVTLLVLSLPVVSRSLIVSLETDWPLPPTGTPLPGAIVILGGDETRLAPPAIRPGVGPLSLERVRAGAMLARATSLPVLLTGGVIRSGDPSIAQTMAESLRDDFGVAARWTEERSTDTWENAALSAGILRSDGIGSARIVTQAWHMRRALLAFARAGFPAWPSPTQLDAPPQLTLNEFIPSPGASLASYYALHEWIGLAYYRLR